MNLTSKKILFSLSLATSALLITACEEENVIAEANVSDRQSTTAPATSPPVQLPDSSTAAGQPDSAPAQRTGSAGSLTPPEDRPTLEKGVDKVVQMNIEDIVFLFDARWEGRPPSSQMRVMEAILATDEESGEDVVLTAFQVGPRGMGTTASNITRWISQVTTEGEPTVYQYEKDDLLITELLAKGTLVPTGMGTGPTTPAPDSFLFGIIADEAPRGPLYLKITGPQSLLSEVEPGIHTMIETMSILPPEVVEQDMEELLDDDQEDGNADY